MNHQIIFERSLACSDSYSLPELNYLTRQMMPPEFRLQRQAEDDRKGEPSYRRELWWAFCSCGGWSDFTAVGPRDGGRGILRSSHKEHIRIEAPPVGDLYDRINEALDTG